MPINTVSPKYLLIIIFMFLSIIPVAYAEIDHNEVAPYHTDEFVRYDDRNQRNLPTEFSPQSPYVYAIGNVTFSPGTELSLEAKYYYVSDEYVAGGTPRDEWELVYTDTPVLRPESTWSFWGGYYGCQYVSKMPIAGTEAAGKTFEWVVEVTVNEVTQGAYFYIIGDVSGQSSGSSGSPTASDEDSGYYYAQITGLNYPSTVGPGETFQLDISFDYRFDTEVVFNPAIYDSVSEELVVEDYFEGVSGSGSDTVSFEIISPDASGDHQLVVILYFELDGEYYYDDAGFGYVDLTVTSGSGSGSSTPSQPDEPDEPDGGIPGFPFMAVVLGLIFFSLWGRRYTKSGTSRLIERVGITTFCRPTGGIRRETWTGIG